MSAIASQIAQELHLKVQQVSATIELIDTGNTVPFIARYRKEKTGGLDDTQLRTLDSRLHYLRELTQRRDSIIQLIEQQGKMTPALATQLHQAESKTRLEDLYLPYKKKRRSKGQIAEEAGLGPLANQLWQNPSCCAQQLASQFINLEHQIDDVAAALDGALSIQVEHIAEDADLLQKLRTYLHKHAHLRAQQIKSNKSSSESSPQETEKYQDYFDYQEAIRTIPSHRALAMLRGRAAGILRLKLISDPSAQSGQPSYCQTMIGQHYGMQYYDKLSDWQQQVIAQAWQSKLAQHLESELIGHMKEQAQAEAIKVFATNLQDLLMAAPAGHQVTLGVDPGFRTGCKLAVIDATGKLLETATIYPHSPRDNQAHQTTINLIKKHQIQLIAIGNGTASRETDRFINQLLTTSPCPSSPKSIVVSEAGASVYSASALAAKEFPHLDVSLRGAVSIARRLQDPLAELVKIDPKSIGVGQYQHDVNQSQLAGQLEAVVEDCVNAVGVDVNTASAALLTYIAGLSNTLAHNIVQYRDDNGPFQSRSQLKKVPRLGPKAFEQSAGFLRIPQGKNPLDASAVHPETYHIVQQIADAHQCPLKDLIGQAGSLQHVRAEQFVSSEFGLPTIYDLLKELEKPGRDPRPEFKMAQFAHGVETIDDLTIGMRLEGVVSNVANFGAFVDIGVHQDGLVHISALSDQYVADPRQIVKTGDIVQVSVVDIDINRRRIALSMRRDQSEQPTPTASKEQTNSHKRTNSHTEQRHQAQLQPARRQATPAKKQNSRPPNNKQIENQLQHALANALKKSPPS